MKSLIVTVILFCLLLGAIILNSILVHRTVDHLNDLLSQIESVTDQDSTLSELETYWEKQKKFLSLSVSFRDLDHVEETLVGLRWAYDEQDEKEFRKYHALLTDAVAEIARIERLSLENLF